VKLLARTLVQSIVFFVGLGLLLFVPAGTLHYPFAWAFIATIATITTAMTTYLYVSDPKLLERRLALGERGENVRGQSIIQAFGALSFFGMLVCAGLDHRLGWSRVSSWSVVLVGHAFLVVGYAIVALVFRANTYTSAVVEVAAGQQVVSTGPYAVVRHPMYSGALLVIAGTPLALGSIVALAFVPPLTWVIVARLKSEERYLAEHLTGYAEYTHATPHRLVPHVW
jgi:protein-S-isoprenylcysteine O-methyltransferase Ste14